MRPLGYYPLIKVSVDDSQALRTLVSAGCCMSDTVYPYGLLHVIETGKRDRLRDQRHSRKEVFHGVSIDIGFLQESTETPGPPVPGKPAGRVAGIVDRKTLEDTPMVISKSFSAIGMRSSSGRPQTTIMSMLIAWYAASHADRRQKFLENSPSVDDPLHDLAA